MKNQTKGIIWIVLGICSLPATLMFYGITSFIGASISSSQAIGSGLQEPSTPSILASIVRVLFGLGGLIAVVLVPVGIILGIVYLTKKDKK